MSNVFEISLIGSGSGYGECILLHLGNNEWAIVDSCLNPNTKKPVVLEYLRDSNISCEDVKFIVATHWHDDHIGGISQVLEKCVNAKFYITASKDDKQFFKLLELDKYFNIDEDFDFSSNTSIRALRELDKCDIILKQRKDKGIFRALQDKLIYQSSVTGLLVEVWALSPSDCAIDSYEEEIANLLKQFLDYGSRINSLTPNDKSVAILVKIGEHSMILGADLEHCKDERRGWNAVFKSVCIQDAKATIYKVAHHGSIGAQNEKIWTDLLIERPIAILTPYNKGRGVPNEEEVSLIIAKTDNSYITSDFNKKLKPKKRKSETKKLMNKLQRVTLEIPFEKGQIKLTLSPPDKDWKVELFGAAKRLKDFII